MVRLNSEQILVIGDRDRRMQSAVATAIPSAGVTSVQSVFEAIAELQAGVYTSVLLSAEPVESRPEPATRALRDAAGDARLIVFSEPAREPISRQLVEHGADDYFIAPAEPHELRILLTSPLDSDAPVPENTIQSNVPDPSATLSTLLDLPFADLILSAMLEHPQAAVKTAVQSIAERVAPSIILSYQGSEDPLPTVEADRIVFTHPIRTDDAKTVGRITMELPRIDDNSAAQHMLARMASMLSKAQQVDDRQSRLQKLAITDELTGVYNARYFRHFLSRMIEKAQARRFPVTLLLLDLDNFKRYNDSFGHAVGDDILKQTSAVMKRCVRDHDMVARIGGDEFAIVFWEKEGPRQAYDASQPSSGRLPSTPLIIADRFRKLMKNKDFSEFSALGPKGKGILTISGGMAVYPYDARNAEELIDAADKALMFGAKQSGKNSIYLVGTEDETQSPE